jgi:NAD-dependent oxidoreductase involved in siderophore biosynthesis
MALETMPLQWFDNLSPRSIWGWGDLQRSFCENFASIITHPITHAELRGLKQKGGESLRDYYHRFGELWSQINDITEREVIEAFSHGIMAKWQV